MTPSPSPNTSTFEGIFVLFAFFTAVCGRTVLVSYGAVNAVEENKKKDL